MDVLTHFIHITNDSFYSAEGIDHTRMTQSVASIHQRWADPEEDRTLTIIEGHRVFQNLALVRQAHLLVWIHCPRQVRRARYSVGFNDSDWTQKCNDEKSYLDSVLNIIQNDKCSILNGMQPVSVNVKILLAMMVSETAAKTKVYRAVPPNELFNENLETLMVKDFSPLKNEEVLSILKTNFGS